MFCKSLVAGIATLFLSTSLFAREINFKHFKVKDHQKLMELYGDVLRPGEVRGDNIMDSSPLYQMILDELNGRYQQIGQTQTNEIIERNNGFYVKGINNIGFHYSKDFITFDINVKRTVAPNLFDDRWIVNDEFNIVIDAFAMLSDLRDQDIIDISDTNLGLFVGVAFRRSYRYSHFEESYIKGLVSSFDKLFLSFLKFRNRGYLDLEPYEILHKEDYLSAKAGAVATFPIYGNITGSVAAMIKYTRLANVIIQAVGDEDKEREDGERLRISYDKENALLAGVSGSIQAEFLGFLKVTLLSHDFSYEYADSHKTYLSFTQNDIEKLKMGGDLAYSVDKVLRLGSADVNVLGPYMVSHERRITQNMNSKYMFLIYGYKRSERTEHFQVVKNGRVNTYFRHNAERFRFKQNPLSRLIIDLMRSLFKIDGLVKNVVSESRRMSMEYEGEYDIIQARKDLNIQDGYKLSVDFTLDYFVNETTNFFKKMYKDYAVNLLEKYSYTNKELVKLVKENKVRGPLRYQAKMLMGKEAVNYLNELPLKTVYKKINEVCDAQKSTTWDKIKGFFNICNFMLFRKYEMYFTELTHHDFTYDVVKGCALTEEQKKDWPAKKQKEMQVKCMQLLAKKMKADQDREIPLWRLKSFLDEVQKQSRKKEDLFTFFHQDNVFFYGSLEAKTDKKHDFRTYFSDGQFQDLGVVDYHQRREGLLVPIPVP